MKEITTLILLIVISNYLIASFITLHIDFRNWTEEMRVMMVFSTVLGCIMLSFYNKDNFKNKN